MLKITRSPGEKIFIGEDIVIEFIGLNQVGEAEIGIRAPKRIRILRQELAQKMAAEIEIKSRAELNEGKDFHDSDRKRET